ncbi:rhodanese-like domain-containing protein [Oceanisphaera avium]|uniref:Rhodanese domain-containing protein n=1 Tax=Oceanisphaera avium TaxID=1903694 RepID=A0A1Y0CW01_9GAMM|nr:rhodanese-like domain-containing protein [Oceanisphaera avium]ART79106.1 hypothetical protein CBP12_02225 [Oceanisphaera avium]
MKSWIVALLIGTCGFGPGLAGAKESVWIDVANAQDYSLEHLEGALHIPYTHIARGVSARFPDKNTPLKLYDRNKTSAKRATEALQVLGYVDVKNKGALDKLKEQGLVTSHLVDELTLSPVATQTPNLLRLKPNDLQPSSEKRVDYANNFPNPNGAPAVEKD